MHPSEARRQLPIAQGQLHKLEAKRDKALADRAALVNIDHPMCRPSIELFTRGCVRGEGMPPHWVALGYNDRFEGIDAIEKSIRDWRDKVEWLEAQLPTAEEIAAAERWVTAQLAELNTGATQLNDLIGQFEPHLFAAARLAIDIARLRQWWVNAQAELLNHCTEHGFDRPALPAWHGLPAVIEPLGMLFTHAFAADPGLLAMIHALVPEANAAPKAEAVETAM